jgi:hypothetical protein
LCDATRAARTAVARETRRATMTAGRPGTDPVSAASATAPVSRQQATRATGTTPAGVDLCDAVAAVSAVAKPPRGAAVSAVEAVTAVAEDPAAAALASGGGTRLSCP